MIADIYINASRGRVFAHSAGDPAGQLVLGIHGWSQRNGAHTWAPLLEPLAEAGFYAVSVDMPGWGQSPAWPGADLRGAAAVDIVWDILDGLGAAEAVLMGKSWGGGLALHAVLQQPDRVEKLILTAPAFGNLEALAGVNRPVLLAWAKDDPVIPVEWAQEYLNYLPQVQLVTYPTGGHSAAMKNADDFAPRAITFLQA